jgi:AcrR family transcriptional regulator
MQSDGASAAPIRRRGRPVGADSAETRNRILEAARQVINQRGYQAATFQVIAMEAGLTRSSVHHYFASRQQIYGVLVEEAGAVLAECTAKVRADDSVAARLAALVAALQEVDRRDRSQIAFMVSARLEGIRHPELQLQSRVGLGEFITTLVRDAIVRGELPAETSEAPVADMLQALIWGMGFYAGFINSAAAMASMTRQVDRVFSHGLGVAGEGPDSAHDTSGDTPRTVVGQP